MDTLTPELRVAHTADLSDATLEATRALLDDAFNGDFTDQDWEHALGGVHALLWEGPDLIGHGSVIQRRLLYRGQALRTGYVEGVGVRADRRRRGHGGTLMTALEKVIRGGYEVGALGASDDAIEFYVTRGWMLWHGPTSALTPAGIRRTEEEDDFIHVFPVEKHLDLSSELTCDWRDGDVW